MLVKDDDDEDEEEEEEGEEEELSLSIKFHLILLVDRMLIEVKFSREGGRVTKVFDKIRFLSCNGCLVCSC